ncbi:MAG: FFLEELY motif protein [Pseudomonadota bacterium]
MSAAEDLRHQLDRYRRLRQHSDAAFRARLYALQEFQARRLRHTHAGLVDDPATRDAAMLFLTDIYGGIDLLPMAEEIERALPLATRLLPDNVLATSATAAGIMTLTQELDEQLATLLFEQRRIETLTAAAYTDAFRAMGRFDDRARQLQLATELGHGLDRYVRSRLVYATFRMARRPAHRYGLGTLYDFLERGFAAMRPLGSTQTLFARMTGAEQDILGRIAGGDPDPFLLQGQAL